MARRARCTYCAVEYDTSGVSDEGLCPSCQQADDVIYANDPRPVQAVEYQPWRWSRVAMQERLGVTGDVDD